MDWEQRLLLLPSSRKEHPFYCPLLVLGYSKFEVHFVLNACFLHHCKFEKNEWNHSKSGTVCIQLLFVNHTSIKLGQKGRQAQSFLMQEIKCTLKNTQVKLLKGFPVGSDSKESTWNAGHLGSIPRLGRSPGGGHSNSLQYPYLENPMDRGAQWATVHGVTKSQT